jgi:hypothetical protein
MGFGMSAIGCQAMCFAGQLAFSANSVCCKYAAKVFLAGRR